MGYVTCRCVLPAVCTDVNLLWNPALLSGAGDGTVRIGWTNIYLGLVAFV